MATLELRPMGIGDILDTTFRLYRDHFLTFLVIGLVVFVPYAALLAPFQAAVAPALEGGLEAIEGPFGDQQPRFDPEADLGTVMPLILGKFLFALIAFPLCVAAYTQCISAAYLGEDLGAWDSYTRAAPRLIPLLLTQLLAGLVVFGGLLLCIVPGIIFMFWFLLVSPIVILEQKWGTSAMGRSRQLIGGNIGKAILLGIVVALLTGIIGWILGICTAIVPWPHPIIEPFLDNVFGSLLVPLQSAPWVLLYYDLRIRKEAFDLEQLASLPTAAGAE